jgi:endogenous inhibitor of DNA gyrase (YacG/DUF329 family)
MTCPICRKPVEEPADKYYPFCSERCKLIDLGRWASGDYVIPVPLSPDEEDDLPPKEDAQ